VFGRDYHDATEMKGAPQMSRPEMRLLLRGLVIEYVSLAWMIIESLVSISAGYAASSLALLAFGGDSIVELVSSLTVVTYLLRRARSKETDDKRAEWITTLLLFLLIPLIAFGFIYSYVNGVEAESSLPGIAVAVGAVVIMPFLAIQKKKIGSKANLLPLTIDAAESWTCFFMSLALLGGLLANYLWKIWWLDYVAGAVILAFILKEALESLKEVKH
jgi:divalent metal cation (Fe/Co/Zn/Cd) transporter